MFPLTYIDVASRWPEAVPLRSATANMVMQALTEIFSRNGFPMVIISDNGTQFTGKQMREFCKRHNIQKVETAPYRPQSNCIVERLHGTLVPMIHKHVEKKQDWPDLFPLALYFIRMTHTQTSGFSPYKIVHGWEPSSPVDCCIKGGF